MSDPRKKANPKTVNSILVDRGIRHALYLVRLAGGEANWIKKKMPALRKAITEAIVPILADIDSSGVISATDEVLINEAATKASRAAQDFFEQVQSEQLKRLEDIAAYEADFEKRLFEKAIPIEMNFNVPSNQQLASFLTTEPIAGKRMNEWFRDLTLNTRTLVNDEIRQGLIDGESIGDIVRRIRGRRENGFADGVLNTTTRHAEALARTGVMSASNKAREAFHEANSDVIKGYSWVLTLDSRTCFRKGTMVTTKNGKVPIEEIQAGEKVLTHKGRFRSVLNTASKENNGKILTIKTDSSEVTCTPDHEFYALRDGEYQWLEAQDLLLSDRVCFDRDSTVKKSNHFWSKLSGKLFGLYPDHTKSGLNDRSIFSFMSVSNIRMPVFAINFNSYLMRWKDEIHRISSNRVFLDKLYTKIREAYSYIPFRTGFSGMLSIAGETTEASVSRSGANSKSLATAFTVDMNRRPSAFFRTMFNIFSFGSKNGSAVSTRFSYSVGGGALLRTVSIPVSIAFRNFKVFTACWTRFLNFFIYRVAITRAKLSRPWSSFNFKFLSAINANLGGFFRPFFRSSFIRAILTAIGSFFSSLYRSKITTTLRAFFGNSFIPLANANTFFRTIFRTNTVSMFKRFIALFTCRFHANNIQKITVSCCNETVYDIQVSEDESYVANGFVVHNCSICVAGESQNPYPINNPPQLPAHVNCRCLRVAAVKSWEEMGIDLDEAAPGTRASMNGEVPDTMTYEEWFNKQSTDLQEDILGPSRFQAFKNGRSVTAFADNGKTLTLGQLRRMEPDLFGSVSTFKRATTLKEAEDFAKSLGIKGNFKDMSLDDANAINKVLSEVNSRFKTGVPINQVAYKNLDEGIRSPFGRINGNTLEINSKKFTDSAIKSASIYDDDIARAKRRIAKTRKKLATEDFWSDSQRKKLVDRIDRYEESIKEYKSNPFSRVTLSREDLLRHEIGHSIQDELSLYGEKYDIFEFLSPSKMEEIGFSFEGSLAQQLFPIAKKNGLRIGEYATKNDNEYFAESFVAYLQGREKLIDNRLLNIFKQLER